MSARPDRHGTPAGRRNAGGDHDGPAEAGAVRVADVMTAVWVSGPPECTLRAAATLMWQQQAESLLVMDGDRLLGFVTERDLVRAVAMGTDVDAGVLADVMSAEIHAAGPEVTIYEAARLMVNHGVRHLPVVAGGEVRGVVSLRDLATVLAEAAPEAADVTLPAEELVRSGRLVRIEEPGHGDRT